MNAFRTPLGLLTVLFRFAFSELICELSLNTILHQPFRREEVIGCQIHGSGSFQYEVRNLTKRAFHTFRSRLLNYEPVWISIPDEWIDKDSVSLTVPPNATLATISPPKEQRRLSKTTGTYHVLMLRIIALDSEPDLSAEQLYNLTFVDDASLRNQMGKCSFGQLQIVPTEYGVLDVQIDMNATDTQHGLLVEEAYKVTKTLVNEDVDNVQDIVDGVMVVVPPGTLGGWTAFGSFNGKHTSYNNLWGGYLGATMHEIGHNLGLPHAYENGVEYEDQTGYMGLAPQEMHYPRKCYNSPNHWHLGWYSSRTLEIDFESEAPSKPINANLAGFVDYDLTGDDHYVIIKAGNFYMQYNQAKKFNVDTSEMKDMVTIVESGDHKTNLVAGLDSQSRFWQAGTGDTQIMVEFCRSNVSSELNFVEISIGQIETSCGNPPTIQPSTPPTARPSVFPVFDLPSYQPTLLPTAPPSPTPSTVPSKAQDIKSDAPSFQATTTPDAPQRASADGGASEGLDRNPATNFSTTAIDTPSERNGPKSVIKIIVAVLSVVLFVTVVLLIHSSCRHRKSKAGKQIDVEHNEEQRSNNHVVKFIACSESGKRIVDSTPSDSSSAETSPNTSIDSFDEVKCDALESSVCQADVDNKPAQLPSATDIEACVALTSRVRVQNGFLSHPNKYAPKIMTPARHLIDQK